MSDEKTLTDIIIETIEERMRAMFAEDPTLDPPPQLHVGYSDETGDMRVVDVVPNLDVWNEDRLVVMRSMAHDLFDAGILPSWIALGTLAWTVNSTMPGSRETPPSQHPLRQEVLMIIVQEAGQEAVGRFWTVERKAEAFANLVETPSPDHISGGLFKEFWRETLTLILERQKTHGDLPKMY